MPIRIYEQPKFCKVCGKSFLRTIYPSGERERMVHFSKRQNCSWSCSLKGNKNALGKRWITPHRRNPNRSEDLRFRRSSEIIKWRNFIFHRDNYTCKMCGQYGGKLCADHVKPYALFPELRTTVSNGRTLCVGCHKLTPTYGWKTTHYAGKTALLN